ncbi:MAG: hypothetical protein JWM43_1043 [Acidobacteriaceae bacterium]|nr:hypothetical protein [Acidobacteriaceae bacterium]
MWAQGAPPATVYVIRHAEKLTDGRIDLSEKGFERARVLPLLFLPVAGSGRVALARPEVLIATHQSPKSNRPVQTIEPLAAALKLPIQHDVMNEDYALLAQDLLSGKYAGKVVLVSWHHGKIPALVEALGAKAPYTPWPDEQFDRIWRLDWREGRVVLTDLPHGLLPGDSK